MRRKQRAISENPRIREIEVADPHSFSYDLQKRNITTYDYLVIRIATNAAYSIRQPKPSMYLKSNSSPGVKG